MDGQIRYIQVAVPLKLSWNPTYSTYDRELSVGDRVKVRITGHLLDAVVIATDITPDIDTNRIQPIVEVVKGLERITPGELELWNFISSYYLCTLGEVYKSAYPSGKIQSEETAAAMYERRRAIAQRRIEEAEARRSARIEKLQGRIEAKEAELSKKHSDAVMQRLQAELEALKLRLGEERATGIVPSEEQAAEKSSAGDMGHCGGNEDAVAAVMASGKKPVLVQGDPQIRYGLYAAMASRMLAQGRSTLILSPDIARSRDIEAVFAQGEEVLSCRSTDSTVHKRKVAEALRKGGAHIILGTRAAIFLPFTELGLVIIDEEHDSSYKQDSPAPRYNGRDTAVWLATAHHAKALLGSSTPSLESLHNAHEGRYAQVDLGSPSYHNVTVELIDTAAEKRKHGMVGQVSRKLIEAVEETAAMGGRSLVITPWNDKSSLTADAAPVIPGTDILNMREARTEDFGAYSLVALVQADTLLGGEDFRTDEKALQLFDRFRIRCSRGGRKGRFIIQTGKSDHQVFKGLQEMVETGISAYELLLPEREMFGFPPFSRMVDVIIRDDRPKRLEFMASELSRALSAALRPGFGAGAAVQLIGPVTPEAWKEDHAEKRTIRVLLKRDGRLAGRKQSILNCVSEFEKEKKYPGHITIDVDPQ